LIGSVDEPVRAVAFLVAAVAPRGPYGANPAPRERVDTIVPSHSALYRGVLGDPPGTALTSNATGSSGHQEAVAVRAQIGVTDAYLPDEERCITRELRLFTGLSARDVEIGVPFRHRRP
jgi:hypothetical protein